MRWQQKLNKQDRAHLRDTNARTLSDVRANIAFQDTMTFPCWDCVTIARKLGISCPLTAFTERCFRETHEQLKKSHWCSIT